MMRAALASRAQKTDMGTRSFSSYNLGRTPWRSFGVPLTLYCCTRCHRKSHFRRDFDISTEWLQVALTFLSQDDRTAALLLTLQQTPPRELVYYSSISSHASFRLFLLFTMKRVLLFCDVIATYNAQTNPRARRRNDDSTSRVDGIKSNQAYFVHLAFALSSDDIIKGGEYYKMTSTARLLG